MMKKHEYYVNSIGKQLQVIYDRLLLEYGPQHWWPAYSPFEVIIGAILTQSAAWKNVEKAINNLRSVGVLSIDGLQHISLEELAQLIRPCGYYNAKAKKLKAFVSWLSENYDDHLHTLFENDIGIMREKLLSVHGIGEETADSIILYAAGKPSFVIDAYTKRIMSRIGILPVEASYGTFQKMFMENLEPDVRMFNEYHALLVNLGKLVCKKTPLCRNCCLQDVCGYYKEVSSQP